ncbi:hypothetical protein VM1G_10997 [Cytospora mali]|uniref:AroM protein n=1 Tax=Cytospora mali TaxID=578113 RepID=A0A194VK05_CYTMA|nr:hypothetical protein VM1G_10997 [Valsa mali]
MSPSPPPKTHSLALITIGQSPRHDYTADVPSLLPPHTTLTQYGALDRLTLPDVQAHLWPSADTKQVLVSRMRDGTEVKMDAEKLEPLIKECVQRVASQEKPDAILLLCTGNLPSYDVSVPVVGPQDAVRQYFEEEKKDMQLVTISPEKRQVAPAKARWDGVGGSVVLGGTMATPYGEGSPAEVEAAAEWVASLPEIKSVHTKGNTLVYMDCMGYTLGHKRLVEKITKGTVDEVVVPREVVFRAVGRLFGENM